MKTATMIDNKVKAMYINLLKDGYYLRPQKFDNCTIVQLTKDLHPTGEATASRKIFCEVNITTAKNLSEYFGFKISKCESYFGKAEPIETGLKRQFIFN